MVNVTSQYNYAWDREGVMAGLDPAICFNEMRGSCPRMTAHTRFKHLSGLPIADLCFISSP